MNEKTRRKSGIVPVGDVSWGTHLCLFYHTKQDLLDILVPYFRVGLENQEFCMWITSAPLSAEDAKTALERVVENLDSYIENGQIEILDYSQWYVKSGKFEADKVLQAWIAKENQAIERGFDGLRLTGNTFWLEKEDWAAFADYEAKINHVIGQYHMLAICTYSLDRCGATEVIEVVSNHQFALVKRESEWEIIEGVEQKHSEEEIRRMALLLDTAPNSITVHDFDGRFLYANQRTFDLHGFTRDEFLALNLHQLDVPDSEKLIAPRMQELLDHGEATFQVAHYRKDGSTLPLEVSARVTTWGDKKVILSIATDITERKRMDEEISGLAKFPAENPNPVLRLNRDGIVIYANAASDALLGMWDCAVGNYAPQSWRDLIAQALASGQSRSIDVECAEKVYSFFVAPVAEAGYVNLYGRDITERKRAEESLRESESKLKALIDNTADTIWSIDTDYRLTSTNATFRDALAKFIGRENSNGESVFTGVSQAIVDEWKPLYARALGGETFTHVSIAHGGWRGSVHRETFFNPIRGQDDMVVGVACFSRDITERKRAEEEIQREKVLSNSIIENMPAGVAFLDNDFVLRRCNRAYAALIRTYLSLSPEQALGMSYFDYAPGSREQVEEWFTKVRDSGQSETRYGFKLVLKQDREQVTYWDTSIAPVFSSAGNVEGILILTQDITERKRAEEALQQSEKRFRALVEHATDLVAVIDREGTCRYASPSFEPMLGYAPEELIGKDLFLLVHPDDLPDARRAVAIRVENAGVASNLMQVRLRYSDGSWRVHEGIGNNLLDDPAVQGIVITSRDITERKRAEDELRKKDEHHRNVVESIFRFVPEGLLVFTEDLGLVNQNKAFEEITQQYAVRLGYTEQELAELIAEQVRSRLLSGDAARAEIHIPKKRG